MYDHKNEWMVIFINTCVCVIIIAVDFNSKYPNISKLYQIMVSPKMVSYSFDIYLYESTIINLGIWDFTKIFERMVKSFYIKLQLIYINLTTF